MGRKKQNIDFPDLVTMLLQFRMNCAPCRESEIESALEIFLSSRDIPVRRQKGIPNGRLDIVVGNYIIEVKMTGQKNIVDQLDRYSRYCDGLIVVCWKATKPLRMIFTAEKKTAKIPVELIEVRVACGMV